MRRRIRRLGDVLLVILVLAIIVMALHKSSGKKTAPRRSVGAYAADVKIADCGFDQGLFESVAHLTITNSGKETATYFVDVVFRDGATRYAESVVEAPRVATKKTARITASEISSQDAPAHLTCTIASVQRYAADSTPGGSAAARASLADVKKTSCGYTDNAATAGLTITNHSGRTLNYFVTVLFVNNHKLYASAIASTNGLKPSHHVNVVAAALTTGAPPTALTCGVLEVDRYP